VSEEKFNAREIKWAPDGKGLILLDKDTFCCSFEVEDQEGEGPEEEQPQASC
jgi:hypothetical protein